MELLVRHCHDCLIIAIAGDVDFNSQAQLGACLTHAVSNNPCIIIDLAQTTFVSAAGLRLLAQTHDTARARGGWLRVAGPSNLVQRSIVRGAFQDKILIASTPEAACHGNERPQAPPTP